MECPTVSKVAEKSRNVRGETFLEVRSKEKLSHNVKEDGFSTTVGAIQADWKGAFSSPTCASPLTYTLTLPPNH